MLYGPNFCPICVQMLVCGGAIRRPVLRIRPHFMHRCQLCNRITPVYALDNPANVAYIMGALEDGKVPDLPKGCAHHFFISKHEDYKKDAKEIRVTVPIMGKLSPIPVKISDGKEPQVSTRFFGRHDSKPGYGVRNLISLDSSRTALPQVSKRCF